MIVAGIGYRQAATLADLQAALALTGATPTALASVAGKADGEVMVQLARNLNLPVIAVTEEQIADLDTATQSARIKARFGTGSLAEAVALAGAGHGAAGAIAHLTVPRVQTDNGMATAAIAERTTT
ncbi:MULTISPECIES: cobalamin biosynthesis protein [unclassified Roseovarius]|uniref:cobalamin biosynthesis protein n=1 Tax=unclassified Roseovarius TaxID=2614913 RepID=UPI00273D74EF|nr:MULTISPECIES: cobalamin biosynthesis protein [unclassified Roseovarius]